MYSQPIYNLQIQRAERRLAAVPLEAHGLLLRSIERTVL
jgi:hypothetical protein